MGDHGRLAGALGVLVFAAVGLTARGDLAAPGPYPPGWRTVTVTRPNSSTFSARLFYPAVTAGQNAAFDPAGGPYPAISFGHGFLQAVSQYQSTCQHLATHGYLVIASESEGGLFPNHQNFANDLRHCLTWLEQRQVDPASFLFGSVDVNRFGMSGHSMGGGASILATAADARVKTLANLAAADTNPSAISAMAGVSVPFALLAGSQDTITPLGQHQQPMYNNGRAPRQLAVIVGGFHCGFTDASFIGCDTGSISRATQLAIVRRLLTAWFHLHLKGLQDGWQAVWGPAATSDGGVLRTIDSGVGLSPAVGTAAGAIGETVSVNVAITNSGPSASDFALFADGDWPAVVSPGTTGIVPSAGSAVVVVSVTVPAGPPLESRSILISARRELDGGTRGYATISVSRLRVADIDADGAVSAADVSLFVEVLLGLETDPARVFRSDVNQDGVVDGDDVQVFVAAVV